MMSLIMRETSPSRLMETLLECQPSRGGILYGIIGFMPLEIYLQSNDKNFNFLGNRIFQHLVALRFLELLNGDVLIYRSGLISFFGPRFSGTKSQSVSLPPDLVEINNQQVPYNEVISQYKNGTIKGIFITSCGMDIKNFNSYHLHLSTYLNELLADIEIPNIPSDQLLVNIRMGDIGNDVMIHRDMYPLPISYYKKLRDTKKTQLAFLGQVKHNDYIDELKKAFPDSKFLELGVLESFKTIRQHRSVAIAVSSFSFLAAWSSDVISEIEMPVAGFFNPAQRPDVNLLSAADKRFTFWPFPEIRRVVGEGMKDFLLRFEIEYQAHANSNARVKRWKFNEN